MSLIKQLLFLPVVIVDGVRICFEISIDPPRRLNLNVDRDYGVDPERDRREAVGNYVRPIGENADYPWDVAQPLSSLTHVRLKYVYFTEGQERTTPCCIAINNETRRIDWNSTTCNLFSRDRPDYEIGHLLVSAPVIILMSPVVFALRHHYERQEKRSGMSRHCCAILKALRGQLDESTEALLVDAFKKAWAHAGMMSRQVTLEEAKDILSSYDLSEEILRDDGEPTMHDFHWFDDHGNYVAEGAVFSSEDRNFVRVCGSRFEGDDVDALIACYRSRKEDRIE